MCDSQVLSGTVSQVVLQRLLEESDFVEVLRSFAAVDAEAGIGDEGGCQEDGDGQTNCRSNSSVFFCGTTRGDFGSVAKQLRNRFSSSNSLDQDNPNSQDPHRNGMFVPTVGQLVPTVGQLVPTVG